MEDTLFNYVRLDGTWYMNAFEDIISYSGAHDISANENNREITFTTTQAVPLNLYQSLVHEFRGLKLYYEAHGQHMSLHGNIGGIHYVHNTQRYEYNNIAEYQVALAAHQWAYPPLNITYDILNVFHQN
jgi:hypothetical protein